MWSRTLAGFVLGLALAISLMLNLHWLLPLALDTRLLIGLLIGFVLWAATMTWFYAQSSWRRASWHCLKLLLASTALNAVLML